MITSIFKEFHDKKPLYSGFLFYLNLLDIDKNYYWHSNIMQDAYCLPFSTIFSVKHYSKWLLSIIVTIEYPLWSIVWKILRLWAEVAPTFTERIRPFHFPLRSCQSWAIIVIKKVCKNKRSVFHILKKTGSLIIKSLLVLISFILYQFFILFIII